MKKLEVITFVLLVSIISACSKVVPNEPALNVQALSKCSFQGAVYPYFEKWYSPLGRTKILYYNQMVDMSGRCYVKYDPKIPITEAAFQLERFSPKRGKWELLPLNKYVWIRPDVTYPDGSVGWWHHKDRNSMSFCGSTLPTIGGRTYYKFRGKMYVQQSNGKGLTGPGIVFYTPEVKINCSA